MIVSDASPLICLAKVEKLSLLRELFGRVVIEEEVKREAIVRGKEEGASDALVIENAVKEGWMEVEKIEDEKSFKGIHKGEGNTILLAKKHKDEAIKTLDEMIEDGFRISTRIYAKFLVEVKIS